MRKSWFGSVLALLVSTSAFAQPGGVVQDFSYECEDPVFLLRTPVAAWGPGVCKPPSPFDQFNAPQGGWGATGNCSTGGSFSCNVGDTFYQTPVSVGLGTNLSTNFVLPSVAAGGSNVPGLAIGSFAVPATFSVARSAVVITTDGGVQVNSTVQGAFDIVDVTLYRDTFGAGQTALLTRRVYAMNGNPGGVGGTQQALSQWSFTYTDRPAAGGIYSYHVQAQLVGNNGPNAVVAGSAATVPFLRGTITAYQTIY